MTKFHDNRTSFGANHCPFTSWNGWKNGIFYFWTLFKHFKYIEKSHIFIQIDKKFILDYKSVVKIAPHQMIERARAQLNSLSWCGAPLKEHKYPNLDFLTLFSRKPSVVRKFYARPIRSEIWSSFRKSIHDFRLNSTVKPLEPKNRKNGDKSRF